MLKKALETGISLHRGSVGELGGGFTTGDFDKQPKSAL